MQPDAPAAPALSEEVLLPRRNREHWREVPGAMHPAVQYVWLETVEDAVHAGSALQERPRFEWM